MTTIQITRSTGWEIGNMEERAAFGDYVGYQGKGQIQEDKAKSRIEAVNFEQLIQEFVLLGFNDSEGLDDRSMFSEGIDAGQRQTHQQLLVFCLGGRVAYTGQDVGKKNLFNDILV